MHVRLVSSFGDKAKQKRGATGALRMRGEAGAGIPGAIVGQQLETGNCSRHRPGQASQRGTLIARTWPGEPPGGASSRGGRPRSRARSSRDRELDRVAIGIARLRYLMALK